MARSRPLRVLVVTNMYPMPGAPWFGIFVAEQVDSLRRRGVEIDVLFVNGSAGRIEYARGFGRVWRAARAKSYDLVHAHYVFCGILALAQRRAPVLLTHHGIETQLGWTPPLCRWTARRVARNIATSRWVRDGLGMPGVDIVPCGVDLDLFQQTPQDEARAALGLPADERLVLFAGRRRPEKRFDLVEASVSLLQAELPGVRLVVADGEPHERIPLYMSACDVLILASRGEGSPMVIKEAMACNLPIVSVDVGDVAEVTGGVPGCYVVGDAPAELAHGLAQALRFGGRTEGRAAVASLSLASLAERLEALYGEVAGEGTAVVRVP